MKTILQLRWLGAVVVLAIMLGIDVNSVDARGHRLLGQRRNNITARFGTADPVDAPAADKAEAKPSATQPLAEKSVAPVPPTTAPPTSVASSPEPSSVAKRGAIPAERQPPQPPVAQPTPSPAVGDPSVKIDPELPAYQEVQAFNLRLVGSDTMKNQMIMLVEGFRKFYPNIGIEIDSKGSSSAPPALVAGTAQFAAMSRGMKAKEVDTFKKKFGYPPVALPTSIDMLAVYVHKDNPLRGLTLQQVDAIFSQGRKGGAGQPINTWGDLGLVGEWAEQPIKLYGRNAESGTQQFFREHALFNGAFRAEVQEQPDSHTVVERIAADKFAIGYSGIGFRTADVRALPLALDAKSDYIPAESVHAYSGAYPLTRVLLLYVNYQPGVELDPLRREFVRYLYSREGQADVVRSGFLPLDHQASRRALGLVGLKH